MSNAAPLTTSNGTPITVPGFDLRLQALHLAVSLAENAGLVNVETTADRFYHFLRDGYWPDHPEQPAAPDMPKEIGLGGRSRSNEIDVALDGRRARYIGVPGGGDMVRFRKVADAQQGKAQD